MDIVEPEKQEAEASSLAFFIARIAVVGMLIITATSLITNVAWDWLGAPLLK